MMHVESNAINVCMAHIGNGFFKCRIVQGFIYLTSSYKEGIYRNSKRGGNWILHYIVCHVFLFLFLKKFLVHK